MVVTGSTLGDHRAARLEAERQRNGQPRKVRYESIPATDLTTADVVQLLVLPVAHETHQSYAAARVPAPHVGSPTHFASHAWGRPFRLLVEGLQTYFAGAVPKEVRAQPHTHPRQHTSRETRARMPWNARTWTCVQVHTPC